LADHIKEDKMGGACDMYWEKKNALRVLLAEKKEREDM